MRVLSVVCTYLRLSPKEQVAGSTPAAAAIFLFLDYQLLVLTMHDSWFFDFYRYFALFLN